MISQRKIIRIAWVSSSITKTYCNCDSIELIHDLIISSVYIAVFITNSATSHSKMCSMVLLHYQQLYNIIPLMFYFLWIRVILSRIFNYILYIMYFQQLQPCGLNQVNEFMKSSSHNLCVSRHGCHVVGEILHSDVLSIITSSFA